MTDFDYGLAGRRTAWPVASPAEMFWPDILRPVSHLEGDREFADSVVQAQSGSRTGFDLSWATIAAAHLTMPRWRAPLKCSGPIYPVRSPHLEGDRGFADSPLEQAGFELVWGFSCQVVVLGFAESSLFGAGKPFFIPSPAIRFPERAEGVKGPKR